VAETFTLRRQEDRCPHAYYPDEDGPALCKAPGNEGKVCVLETGGMCEEWEDIKKEWAEEEKP